MNNKIRLSILALFIVSCFSFANDVTDAASAIASGNFDKAAEIASTSEAQGMEKIRALLDREAKLAAKREKLREDKYNEKVEELNKIIERCLHGDKANINRLADFSDAYVELLEKEKAEKEAEEKTSEPVDAEQGKLKLSKVEEEDDEKSDSETTALVDFLVAVSNINEYCLDDQKQELLESEFVKDLVKAAISKAISYENEGKWADSYGVCYYWLTLLYPDNKSYKDKMDELIEKMTVVGSFIDSPCEKATERAEGIDLVMLHRTVKMLTYTYISPLDFEKMLDKGLQRCITIAEVLSKPDKDIAVSYNPEGIQRFVAGMRQIQKDFTPSVLDKYYHTQLLDAFNRVLRLNAQTLQLPVGMMIMHFTEAILSELDPYTNIVWPFYVKEFEKNITNEFTGIGVEISKPADEITVNSLLEGTPAYRSGLDAEDVILKVDGVSTEGMSINCAVTKISGPRDTKVTLTVRHKQSGEVEDITIKRGVIVVPTIKGWKRADSSNETGEGDWSYIIDEENKIGFMRLTSFSEATTAHMVEAITEMKSEGLRGLILDLRYNSGGLLTTAVNVTNMFIEKGPIVSTKPRMGVPEKHEATQNTLLPNTPLVLLINSGSASASEIVSGALSDPLYKRATLVGERTFGKGSVQTVTAAPGLGAQLKYTMAFYYLPSGEPVKNRYQLEKVGRKDWGIAPDVELDMYGSEIRTQLDMQKANDILVKDGHIFGDGEDNGAMRTAEDVISSDPQLEMGIIVLKAKMLVQGLL
ncbi:MAG: S41 family peptidase [Phycisphaerae bacterium]